MTTSAFKPVPPTIPGPIPDTRRPRFQMPKNACDCHAHLFGPQDKYAYAAERRYTPPDATLSKYLNMLKTLGVERAVLVQPSVYTTDNSALLDALEAKIFPLRGIVVVDPSISDEELKRMHALGVRGIRLGASTDVAQTLAKRIAHLGWHLQFRGGTIDFPNAESFFKSLPVDVVIDHIGRPPVSDGLNGKAFRSLLGLVEGGRTWVKLSAPMQTSAEEYPYADVTPFVKALINAGPDRMIWGTDWPHTTVTRNMPNDGDLADLLPDWIPDETTQHKVLTDNPATLFDF